jgi:hypothetical protein
MISIRVMVFPVPGGPKIMYGGMVVEGERKEFEEKRVEMELTACCCSLMNGRKRRYYEGENEGEGRDELPIKNT